LFNLFIRFVLVVEVSLYLVMYVDQVSFRFFGFVIRLVLVSFIFLRLTIRL
jgi:hypothetical protein